MRRSRSLDLSYPAQGWVYFLVFAAANALLSYAPLSFSSRLWIFLLCVLFPLGLGLASMGKDPGSSTGPFTSGARKPLPWAAWWALIGLGIILRLGQVVVPGNWPSWDDGHFAYYSVELLRQWRFTLFFSVTQHPPFFNWLLTLFYHLVPPSLTALWLYPALLSILGLGMIGLAARRLFPNRLAFLWIFLMAFSFWPLYAGKFCMYMPALVFWESLTLAVLAYWVEPKKGERTNFLLGVLGACVGFGFWVAIAWPVVVVTVVGAVLYLLRREKNMRWKPLAAFLGPITFSAFLYAWVSISSGNGAHMAHLWTLNGTSGLLRRITDSVSNLTVLFWGCDLQNAYGPPSGGVLDPLEGACFFLGLLECWRFRRHPWTRWLVLSFCLMLIPGLVTQNFELFRNSQVIPFLLLLTALGASTAPLSLPARTRNWTWGMLLTICLFLDLRQLWLTYQPDAPGPDRPSSVQMAHAFAPLQETSQRNGPGVLLFEVKPHEADQTLAIATYSFNAAVNPRIDLDQVQWMAVVVDANLRPFLVSRFPAARWVDLFQGETSKAIPEPLDLIVIPIGPGGADRQTLGSWVRADEKLRDLDGMASNLLEESSHAAIFKTLPGIYPAFQGDPFLESIYWDAVYDFHRWENLFGDRDRSLHFPAALDAVRQGIERGYPTAYFYDELGSFYVLMGDNGKAKVCFEKAIHAPLDLTPAAENLKALEEETKEPTGSKHP